MHLSVKGKHIDVGDALRTHVEVSLNSVVAKYFEKPMEANVVFSREAHLFKADISVHIGRGILLQSTAEAAEPYPAFDTAADKIAKRLRRYKRRLRDHHNRRGEIVAAGDTESLAANQYILEAEREDHHVDGHEEGPHQPVIIAEMAMAIDTLTVGEAVMRMDLAELPVLMFRSSAHGGLNMVYRRPDGNVGWVDPKGSQGADA